MKLFDNRADSEVIDHVILLGIAILGISMIILYGVPVIKSLQNMAHVKNAEHAFTVFDSRTSRAALAEAPRQATDMNLGGGYISVMPNSSEEPSFVLIQLKNGTSSLAPDIYIPMGKIVYRLENREVAYEGGGVWSKYPLGSIMISPPEFHYNGITLTLPVINILDTSSKGGEGTVSLNIEKKNTLIIYPKDSYSNPIPEDVTHVNITIKSEYYYAWANYFKSIPLANVYLNASEKKVTVTLSTPPLITNFSYGALASKTIYLGQSAKVDSYNSSIGNYSISRSDNGSIRANEKITLRNTAMVNGSALSGGSIDCDKGNSCGTIIKDAYGEVQSGITVGGLIYSPVDILKLKDTSSLVKDKINVYKASLPNPPAACLSGPFNTILDMSGGSCTISSGNYYLTKINIYNNADLKFDTNSGPVNIAAEIPANDYIEFTKASIGINGTNPVRLYLRGGGKKVGSDNVAMIVGGAGANDAASVNIYGNPNQTSSRFQVFSASNYEIQIQQQSQFCGFVYAPRAKISIEQGTQIFGALVGSLFSVTQSQDIHFDEALRNLYMDLGLGTTVMYLHITRNDLEANVV